MTDDLVAFLRARYDEDERAAHGAAITEGLSGSLVDFLKHEAMQVDVAPSEAHYARHDPARTLADIDAKRQILDLHPYTTQRAECSESYLRAAYGPNWEKRLKNLDTPYCETCNVEDGVIESDGTPCATLRLLALPYADHPDHREEWRL